MSKMLKEAPMDEKENYEALEDHPNYSVGDEKMEAIIKRYGEGTQVLFEIPDSEYGEIDELVRAIKTIQYLLSLLSEKDKRVDELEKSITIKILENAKGAQVLSDVEEQLRQETISVNELSLANQELEKKIEELENKVNRFASYLKGSGEDIDRFKARIKSLEEGIEKLYKLALWSHYYSDDCWYTCPKHPDGSCNTELEDKTKCNCGADFHNKDVEELYNLIKGGKIEIK